MILNFAPVWNGQSWVCAQRRATYAAPTEADGAYAELIVYRPSADRPGTNYLSKPSHVLGACSGALTFVRDLIATGDTFVSRTYAS